MTAFRWLAAVVLVLVAAAFGIAPAGAAAPGRGGERSADAPEEQSDGGRPQRAEPEAPAEHSPPPKAASHGERPERAGPSGRQGRHDDAGRPEGREGGAAPAPRHEPSPAAAPGRAEPAAEPAAEPQAQPAHARDDGREDRGQERSSGRQHGPQQGGGGDRGNQPGEQRGSDGDHGPGQHGQNEGQQGGDGQQGRGEGQQGRGDGRRPERGPAETAEPADEQPYAAAGAVHVSGVSLGFEVIAVSGGTVWETPGGGVRAASAGRSLATLGRPGRIVGPLAVVPVADVAEAGPVMARQAAPRTWSEQYLEPVARVPLALASEPAFPLVLGIAIAAFLVLFGRGDRRDPKLTAAAIGGRRDRARFS